MPIVRTRMAIAGACTFVLAVSTATAGPQTFVSPASIHFPTMEQTGTLTICNVGDHSMNWSLTANQPWIQFSPQNGATNTGTDVVTVTVNRTSLAAKQYSASITVISDGGNRTVTVTMDVAAALPWPIAPQASPHVFDHGIGGYEEPDAAGGFHGGVDIPALAGTPVMSIITGVVLRIDPPASNGVGAAVWVTPDATASDFAWEFAHLSNVPPGFKSVMKDGAANATPITDTHTRIGDIIAWPTNHDVVSHTHIAKAMRSASLLDLYNTTIINPLFELSPKPTLLAGLDPMLFKRDGSTTKGDDFKQVVDGARVVQDDIDFVSHATTLVDDGVVSLADRAEINALTYRIAGQGRVAGHDVSERCLMDFTVITPNFQDLTKAHLVYDLAHRTTEN